MHRSIALWVALAIILVGLSGCKNDKGKPETAKSGTPETNVVDAKPVKPIEIKTEEDQRVLELIKNEDLVLDCSVILSRYAKWFERVSAGDLSDAGDFPFESLSDYSGPAEADVDSLFAPVEGKPEYVSVAHWPIADQPDKPNPWGQLLKWKQGPWETVKFGVVSAEFTDESQSTFVMHTKVEGRLKNSDKTEPQFGFKGYQDLTWTMVDESWELKKWDQLDFLVKKTEHPLFHDVLADVLGAEDQYRTLANAIRSYKDEMIVELTERGKVMLPVPKFEPWLKVTSDFLFPAVSVVDYNNDGFEDLYLTARWGPSQMLRNNGDGTFTEVTHDIGLYFKHLVNCAVFADFDNDGDKDALIGRPLETAVYLENENGIFKDVTKSKSNMRKLYFVSAISVSDINQDGLLDVYFSTYAPLVPTQTGWGAEFLEFQELKKVEEHSEGRNMRYNLGGTANVLMMNRGDGRLERIPFDETVSQWRRSFQSVWADIDNDGDDDLYICNDFARDALLRNETKPGDSDPVLTDVTDEVLVNKGVGFGMGASFGDFDRDGDFDIYVSNMFSKAGRRILKKIQSTDERIVAATSGNFLYVNNDGKFDQEAGSEDDDFHVNQVGWSYGGQWADFDNNGQLDLYVPSGFFTAPKQASTEVDT